MVQHVIPFGGPPQTPHVYGAPPPTPHRELPAATVPGRVRRVRGAVRPCAAKAEATLCGTRPRHMGLALPRSGHVRTLTLATRGGSGKEASRNLQEGAATLNAGVGTIIPQRSHPGGGEVRDGGRREVGVRHSRRGKGKLRTFCVITAKGPRRRAGGKNSGSRREGGDGGEDR